MGWCVQPVASCALHEVEVRDQGQKGLETGVDFVFVRCGWWVILEMGFDVGAGFVACYNVHVKCSFSEGTVLGCALKRGEGCFVVYCASKTNFRAALGFIFGGFLFGLLLRMLRVLLMMVLLELLLILCGVCVADWCCCCNNSC